MDGAFFKARRVKENCAAGSLKRDVLGRSPLQCLLFFLYLLTTNCVSVTRPAQDWRESVDFHHDVDVLKKSLIKVTCGKGEQGSLSWSGSSLQACSEIKRSLQSAGADLYKEEEPSEEKTEAEIQKEAERYQTEGFELVYVDRGRVFEFSGLNIFLSVLSVSLVPFILEGQSYAQIMFREPDGSVKGSYPLSLEWMDMYGIGALPFLGTQVLAQTISKEHKVYQKQTKAKLMNHIRNLTYTYYERKTCGFTLCF